MINQDENRVLCGLLLLMLLCMVSTAYAAPGEPAGTVAAAETAEQTGETGPSNGLDELLSSSAMHLQEPSGAVIIPLVAILSVFGGPVIVVLGIALAVVWYHHRRRRLIHDTLNRMIDQGMEIPPHMSSVLDDPEPRRDAALRKGLLLSGLGIGLIIFFLTVGAATAAGIGAIPLFIGFGYLLIWRLEDRQSASVDENSDNGGS